MQVPSFPLDIEPRDLDESESFNLEIVREDWGIPDGDFTLKRQANGLAVLITGGREHDLTNGLWL